MARLAMNAFLVLSRSTGSGYMRLSRRSYAAVAAEAPRAPAAVASMAAKAVAFAGAESGSAAGVSRKEVFWMRDPRTGNWMPENRFAEVDAAELRARLLKGGGGEC